MANNFKKFLNLIKFEIVKLYRKPFMLIFVLVSPILINLAFLSMVGSVQGVELIKINNQNQKTVAPIVCFASNNVISSSIDESFCKYFEVENIDWKRDSLDNKIKELKRGDYLLLIYVDEESSPKITAYYNNIDLLSINVAQGIESNQTDYEFNYLRDYLSSYGITFNEEFFNLATFAGVKDVNNFNIETMLTTILSFVLSLCTVVGISFSLARELETGTAKHLSFSPISSSQYLLSKLVVYLVIGVIEIVLFFLMLVIFNVPLESGLFASVGLCILFVLAIIAMSMLMSCMKNQLIVIGLVMISVIVPIMLLILVDLSSLSIVWKAILYLCPVVPFVSEFKSLYFYNVVNYWWLLMLVAQFLIYYIISYFIIKRKTNIGNVR